MGPNGGFAEPAAPEMEHTMQYTPDVAELVDNPLGGRTPEEVREICSSTVALRALAHPPQDFLIEKFCREYDEYTEAEAREIFEDLKRFLVAGELLDRSLAPSLPVDNMWHAWILFTKDYHEFGDLLNGYIHHRPIPKGDAAQPPLEPTIAVMEAAYGSVSDRSFPQELGSYGIMDCKRGV
ncbi:MAG: hypothetical protein REI11_00890 [Patulibacter sp.]|nr:hypothetical protein [Patulibacter sp.]